MSDFSPSLNGVEIKSPTEDGKIAFVMNTMVPRRLDQFDDIKRDLANKDFNTDKAFFYVNFQAGDFCGRSYKLPLSELNEFVTKSLLFGTNGKDPVIKFDDNFYVDENNEIHLIVSTDKDLDAKVYGSLDYELAHIGERIDNVNNVIRLVADEMRDKDNKLEQKKSNKFYILGSGDVLNSEGMPEPKPVTGDDPYGVHVTVTKDTGPIIDDQGSKGPTILIDHEFKLP